MPRLSINGARIYIEERGTGTPIVFLPGLATGIRFFRPQFEALSGDFRTVGLDYRGHGRSETTEIGYTLEQFAADIHAVLEELSLEDVIMVGWSLGALLSWEYIDRYGADRIRGLVDVDMEPSPYQRSDYEYGTYTVDSLRESLIALQTDRFAALEEAMDRVCKDPPTGALREMMLDEMSRCPPTVQGTLMLSLIRDYRPLGDRRAHARLCRRGRQMAPSGVGRTYRGLSLCRANRTIPREWPLSHGRGAGPLQPRAQGVCGVRVGCSAKRLIGRHPWVGMDTHPQ